jgi:phosphatidylglycerol:prolipoprotein diacylglycerol transferase
MYLIPFPLIDPVAFSIGPLHVHWYGIAYVFGIVCAWQYAKWIRSFFDLDEKHIDDFVTWSVVGVIAGGRLGFVLLYDPLYYLSYPLHILMTWTGGMSFHGGLLGVVIATIVYCRRHKIPLMRFADLLAVVTPFGLLLGRLANFINAEHCGRPTDVPWAMIFPRTDGVPRHPSQLYEACIEGLLIMIIMGIVFKRYAQKPGKLTGIYFVMYGVGRFCIEYFRTPDALYSVGICILTIGQLLCIPMILCGVYWVCWYRHESP